LLSWPVNAQSVTASNYSASVDLGKIAITPTRTLLSGDRIAENFSTYTSADIEATPAQNLGEFLSYVPGVDVQVTNGFGQPTSVSIQGSDPRQVLVMIDGIPFNTQLSGQADPSFLPLENVERIEVVRGGASSAWGSSMGGVINIITKDTGKSLVPKVNMTTKFAEFDTQENTLDCAGKLAGFGYFFSGNHMETDGTRQYSGVNDSRFFGKIGHDIGDQAKLEGSFGYIGDKVQDGVVYGTDINETPTYARYGSLKFSVDKGDVNFNAAGKYNAQDIKSETYDADDGSRVSSTRSRNVYSGLSLNASGRARERDIFVLGADFDWTTIKSNNYLSGSKDIGSQATYANYTWRWEDWDFIPGLRYDNNNQFNSQLSPSLGTVYHLPNLEKTLLRLKISRAFNAPPLLWMYNYDPAYSVAPNPDLKAERAIVYEAGFETEMIPRLKLGLNLYRSDVRDAIAVVEDNSGMYSSQNFKKFERRGAQLDIDYKLREDLNLYASGAFNDNINAQTKKIVRDQGIARQSFRIGAKYRHRKGFGLDFYGRYDRWTSPASLQANDRKFILDLRLSQKLQGIRKDVDLELFLNIYNLTNSKYWSSKNFPLPRRYFEGGFKLAF